MDIKGLILEKINQNEELKVADVVKVTGFSRAYINRFFRDLRDEGKIILIGRANQARYVKASKKAVNEAKKHILKINKNLKNKGLSEDTIFEQIKREGGIFMDLEPRVLNILKYSFTEMLNNAIDHSRSGNIEAMFKRDGLNIRFDVIDHGIGIFNNIMKKKNLKNDLEAIQDLLKGKQSTMPEHHSGEGVFFTSKIADTFVIESFKKKLFFNNKLDDIFVQDANFKGTKIIFNISVKSPKKLENIFKEYTGDSFEFNKTRVAVRLYKMNSLHISRSQGRRIMNGLEKFKIIVLDFKHLKNIGQAFADEVFRVWQSYHPNITIETVNSNENIDFMIQRAIKERSGK